MKVEIKKLDHFGRGICYVNDKICFIEGALPGEIVKIKIEKETKKYFLGKIVDFYQLSDDRVVEVCPYTFCCGGCNLSHMSIKAENSFKVLKVKEILKKFAGIDDRLVQEIECADEYYYRNKITLHGKDMLIGYYEKQSNKIVRIDKCFLATERINQAIETLNNICTENLIEEVLIRTSNDSNAIMISIKGCVKDCSKLIDIADTLIVNDEVVFGSGSIISNIGNKKYYVSPNSFFQVNNKLTKKLYDEVLSVVKDFKPKKVLDLYCGTGTIGLYISDLVDNIVGIDCSKTGIEDAMENNKLNNAKVQFICDKVENVIEQFENVDLIIVDPPRSGLDLKTIDNICRIGPKKLIYVSCDPVTLARDLKKLSTSYEVLSVRPYNMFPRTYHVENICILVKSNK